MIRDTWQDDTVENIRHEIAISDEPIVRDLEDDVLGEVRKFQRKEINLQRDFDGDVEAYMKAYSHANAVLALIEVWKEIPF